MTFWRKWMRRGVIDEDRLVAQGSRCTWWDFIENADHSSGFAQCPHCGNLVHRTEGRIWWMKIHKYEETNPGYRRFIERSRGLCFRSQAELGDHLAGVATPLNPFRDRDYPPFTRWRHT